MLLLNQQEVKMLWQRLLNRNALLNDCFLNGLLNGNALLETVKSTENSLLDKNLIEKSFFTMDPLMNLTEIFC